MALNIEHDAGALLGLGYLKVGPALSWLYSVGSSILTCPTLAQRRLDIVAPTSSMHSL